MSGEKVTLSKLADWTQKMQQAREEAEKEREKIKQATVGWREYCKRHKISLPTLIKRRNMGLIPFVMLGAEYRYEVGERSGGING